MKPHPSTIPFEGWSDGWLILEVASRLNDPAYIVRFAHEKREKNQPSTREEMIAFLRGDREEQINNGQFGVGA